jgi:hypothetical protein
MSDYYMILPPKIELQPELQTTVFFHSQLIYPKKAEKNIDICKSVVCPYHFFPFLQQNNYLLIGKIKKARRNMHYACIMIV